MIQFIQLLAENLTAELVITRLLLLFVRLLPIEDFIDEFEEDDPRLDYTVNVDDKLVYKLLGSVSDEYKGNADSPGNRIFIRWADVRLWKAEALLETGDLNAAIQIINEIRERARNTPKPDGSTISIDQLPDRDESETDEETVREWLIHERRVELGFESQRFNDLKRWGIAEQVLTDMAKNYQSYHDRYPIPQSEIDKSGGEMQQNSGY